jgi:hypothetical protein
VSEDRKPVWDSVSTKSRRPVTQSLAMDFPLGVGHAIFNQCSIWAYGCFGAPCGGRGGFFDCWTSSGEEKL